VHRDLQVHVLLGGPRHDVLVPVRAAAPRPRPERPQRFSLCLEATEKIIDVINLRTAQWQSALQVMLPQAPQNLAAGANTWTPLCTVTGNIQPLCRNRLSCNPRNVIQLGHGNDEMGQLSTTWSRAVGAGHQFIGQRITCCMLPPSAAPLSTNASAASRGPAAARQAVGSGLLQAATRHLPSDALTTAHCSGAPPLGPQNRVQTICL